MESVTLNPKKLWFNTPNCDTLCRGGGNGPNHPSQLYAIEKYVYPLLDKNEELSFLDYGSGSATTYEAIKSKWPFIFLKLRYQGADIIPKNVKWCKSLFPDGNFKLYKSDRIEEPDKSFDVVYSRHVVDHQKSFEFGLDEHCRVAKKLVVIILWRPLYNSDEHNIQNIVDQGVVYKNEWTNDYSRRKVVEAIKKKEADGWKMVEMAEGVGKEINKWDVIIVLERNETT